MKYITLLDYVLLPFYFLAIYFIAIRVRNKNYTLANPLRKYFIPALSVKLFGSVFLALIYGYYYGYSDSFGFFEHSQVITSALKESPTKWLGLVFHIPGSYDPDYYKYTSNLYWYTVDDASYIVAVFASILGLLNFNTYIPTSLLFACISFSGVWALFKTFSALYPKFTKQIAVCILFIPGVVMWGSGLLKDTLCLFALGWFTHGIFRLLIQKDFRVSNIVLVIACFLLLAKVKIYILVAFLPAIGIWILFSYLRGVTNRGLRALVRFGVLGIVIGFSFFLMQRFQEQLGAYSLEKISSYAESTRDWIVYSTETQDGSGYSLGNVQFTPTGMLAKFPQAVNVTLFRPYLWEAKKPIVMLSAIESLAFLLVTILVLYRVGLKRTWQTITEDNNIQFCLIFSIVFSFAVGITTYNFGSLSRYKIPCIPFYALGIVLIYYKNIQSKKLLPFL